MNVRINGVETNVSTAYTIVALVLGQKLTNSGKSYAMPDSELKQIFAESGHIMEISNKHPEAEVRIDGEDITAKFALGNLYQIALLRTALNELSEKRSAVNSEINNLLEIRKDSKSSKPAKKIDTAAVVTDLETIFA